MKKDYTIETLLFCLLLAILGSLVSCTKEVVPDRNPVCGKFLELSYKFELDTTAPPLKIDTSVNGWLPVCDSDLAYIKTKGDTWIDFRSCGYYFKWEMIRYIVRYRP